MKTINAVKVLVVLVSVVGLTFVSCKKDDKTKPVIPVKVEDVNGNYSGKLMVTQGTAKMESTIALSSKTNTISIADLPVSQIVLSVVKDTQVAQEIVKKLGKVKYDLSYTAKVNTAKTGVDLTFAPKPIELQFAVNNVNKKVVANVVAGQVGVYTGRTKTLKFGITIDKVTVDGTAITPLAPIAYDFQSLVKK